MHEAFACGFREPSKLDTIPASTEQELRWWRLPFKASSALHLRVCLKHQLGSFSTCHPNGDPHRFRLRGAAHDLRAEQIFRLDERVVRSPFRDGNRLTEFGQAIARS
jgi:hypothetical protein